MLPFLPALILLLLHGPARLTSQVDPNVGAEARVAIPAECSWVGRRAMVELICRMPAASVLAALATCVLPSDSEPATFAAVIVPGAAVMLGTAPAATTQRDRDGPALD